MCNFVKLYIQRRFNKIVSDRFGNQFKQTNHLDHERTRTIKNVSQPNIGRAEEVNSPAAARWGYL